MQEIARANLMILATTYAEATGLMLTTVSKKIHGNNYFLGHYHRREVSVTLAKYDEMITKLSDEWPANTPWPKLTTIPMKRPAKKNV